MSEKKILLGDLVYYIGPPIVGPLTWESIIDNDNGIVSRNDLAIVIETNDFLSIADLFFQTKHVKVHRISYKYLKVVD